MFLTKWRPLGLSPWRREMDDLFKAFDWDGQLAGFRPAVDIAEDEDRFVIKADLPGVSEKEIEIKVHDGVLLLTGKREESTEEKKEGGYYRERRGGSFCRQFRLGSSVDAEKIAASYKNGVLEVILPKKEESKPRQIPVSNN
jgi:HSP20 family protein